MLRILYVGKVVFKWELYIFLEVSRQLLDIALGDRNNCEMVFERLNFSDNRVFKFVIDCSDEDEWIRRHMERLKNPLPHQTFRSIEHVVEHYKKANLHPFEDEFLIDSTKPVEECFKTINRIISPSTKIK